MKCQENVAELQKDLPALVSFLVLPSLLQTLTVPSYSTPGPDNLPIKLGVASSEHRSTTSPQQLSTRSAKPPAQASPCSAPTWAASPAASPTSPGPSLRLGKVDTWPPSPPSSSPLPTWPGCHQPGSRSRRSCSQCLATPTVAPSLAREQTSSSATRPTLWETATQTCLTATTELEPHLRFFLATTMPPCLNMRSWCLEVIVHRKKLIFKRMGDSNFQVK